MKIKDGGALSNLVKPTRPDGVVESIRISKSDSTTRRSFELWINEDSLSYLTIEELLDLRDECNEALKKIL